MTKSFSSLLLLLALILSPLVWAETVGYISDELRVPLRKSPCGSCAIVHRGLIAGTKLRVIEAEGDWAHVFTSRGSEGWVPLQYVVKKPIARLRLSAAEANTSKLADENVQLKQQVESLSNNLDSKESYYADIEARLKDTEVELANLKKLSANAIALQDQNETLIKTNRMLQSETDVLTAARDQLSKDNSQKWFIYGGLAVFLGAILTVILPQLRPNKRFSEWN